MMEMLLRDAQARFAKVMEENWWLAYEARRARWQRNAWIMAASVLSLIWIAVWVLS